MQSKLLEESLWENAIKLMPRGTQTLSKCPDQFVDGIYPKFAKKAKGAYVWDLRGNKYLDFACGCGPIILGYNHPRTNKAIKKQLKNGILFSIPTVLEQKLAQLIIDVIPCAEQVRFAKNGTDATLAAVRIARSYTGKEHILKCGYHGWGDWHGITLRPHGIPSSLSNIIDQFDYNDLEGLDRLLSKGDTAAVIMEAECLTKPAPGFLEGARDLCSKNNALLIFDEIVTGFRWGIGGAQEKYNVIPDLCCLGKAMANGMPISAISGKKQYMQELNHAFFSMTFGGECLSIASSIATIEELKFKNYDYLWGLSTRLSDGIKNAAKKYNLKINWPGQALRHQIEFDGSYSDSKGMKALFFQEMLGQGILYPNIIYLQFSHTHDDISKTISAADKSFKIVAENKDDIEKALKGSRPIEIFRKNV